MCDAVWFDDRTEEAWTMGDLAEIVPFDQWVRHPAFSDPPDFDPAVCLCSVDLPATLAKVGYAVDTDAQGWVTAARRVA